MICGEMFYPNLKDGHQHGGRKPTKTSVTEFCYKIAKLSREDLKNIKTFSNKRSVQIAKLPEISYSFNQHDFPSGRHINAASRKSLGI